MTQTHDSAASARPLGRRIMQVVRRTHLYVGLFLFPWAILYGVTGFLFNHPSYFADAPTAHFTRVDLAGTPLEAPPSPGEQADAVLAALAVKRPTDAPVERGEGEARYATRDSFIATVKAGPRAFFVVYDPRTGSGTIRETTPRSVAERAPFALGGGDAPRQRGMGMGGPMRHDRDGLKLDDSIVERIQGAVPAILERKGFPSGPVTVTTAPDLRFPVVVGGERWTATYNPITTALSGERGPDPGERSLRAFLLRLHLTRGYPGETSPKWFWAIGVDAIALVLCFWGVSGLFMWWQIKATRRAGLVVLTLSAGAAASLTLVMLRYLA